VLRRELYEHVEKVTGIVTPNVDSRSVSELAEESGVGSCGQVSEKK